MSVRAVRRMGSPEVCRGHAEMPLEQMMEMAAVVIACRKGDIPDGKARAAQQACRLLHADVLKIFLKADAQIFLQQQIVIIAMIMESRFQLTGSDRGKMQADIALQLIKERFFSAFPVGTVQLHGVPPAEQGKEANQVAPDDFPAALRGKIVLLNQSLQNPGKLPGGIWGDMGGSQGGGRLEMEIALFLPLSAQRMKEKTLQFVLMVIGGQQLIQVTVLKGQKQHDGVTVSGQHMAHGGAPSHVSDYPWRLANDADITVSGKITPQGTYRKIVWGSHETGLYAQHPKYHGMVYVYSAADEVELWLNGKSCGRAAAGKENRYTAVFEVNYEPGSLSAASFRQGVEEKHKGARWNRKTLEATGQSQKELRPSTKQAAALSLTGAMENRPPLKIRYCR